MKRVIGCLALIMALFLNTIALAETNRGVIAYDGQNMNVSLNSGDYLVYERDVYCDRYDIVMYILPSKSNVFVSRIIGMPGDILYRQNGVTHVVRKDNQQDIALDERYAMYYPFGSPEDYTNYQLKNNEYFVVGDNRYNSHDSRNWNDADSSDDVGPLTSEQIIAKIIGVVTEIEFHDYANEYLSAEAK